AGAPIPSSTERAAVEPSEAQADTSGRRTPPVADSAVVRLDDPAHKAELPERISLYVRDGVVRAGSELPADSAAQQSITVAAMLDSAALALPDPGSFRSHDYRPGLSPEMITRPVVGYTQD